MPRRIVYELSAQVLDGEQWRVARELEVDAYTVADKEVPAAEGGAPGRLSAVLNCGAAEQIRLLLVTASDYTAGVTLALDGAAPGSPGLTLGEPLLLAGSTAVAMLGPRLDAVELANPGDAPVAVTILVGRALGGEVAEEDGDEEEEPDQPGGGGAQPADEGGPS